MAWQMKDENEIFCLLAPCRFFIPLAGSKQGRKDRNKVRERGDMPNNKTPLFTRTAIIVPIQRS